MFKKFLILINRIPRKYTVIFILACAVVAGGMLRWLNASTSPDFSGDPGRDMLVGRHIAIYGEKLLVGHAASGVVPTFYYPPYYYYFLGLLERLIPSVEFVSIVLVVFQTLSIITIFFIAKTVSNVRTGLLSAVLFALSGSMVWKANCITGIAFCAPLFLFSWLVLILKTRDKYVVIQRCMAIFLLLLSATINYSALVFLPIYIVCLPKQYKNKLTSILALSLYSEAVFLLLWSPLIYAFGLTKFLYHMFFSGTLAFPINIFGQFAQRFGLVYNDLFNIKDIGLWVLLPVTVLVGMKGTKYLSNVTKILLPLVYLVVVSTAKRGIIAYHYFTLPEPFVFVAIAYIYGAFFEVYKKNTILRICCVASFLLTAHTVFWHFSYIGVNEVSEKKQLAQEVLRYTENYRGAPDYKNGDFFQVVLSTPSDGWWATSSLLYWMEELKKERFVRLVDYGQNIEQTNRDDYIFWVCASFEYEASNHKCYDAYIKPKAEYAVVGYMTFSQENYFGYVLKKT